MTRKEHEALYREYRILAREWLNVMLHESTKKADATWNATLGSDRFKEIIKLEADLDLLAARARGCFVLKKGKPYKTFANIDLP